MIAPVGFGIFVALVAIWISEGQAICDRLRPSTLCSCHTPLRLKAWRVFEVYLTGTPRYWFGRFVGFAILLVLTGCAPIMRCEAVGQTEVCEKRVCRDLATREFVACP